MKIISKKTSKETWALRLVHKLSTWEYCPELVAWSVSCNKSQKKAAQRGRVSYSYATLSFLTDDQYQVMNIPMKYLTWTSCTRRFEQGHWRSGYQAGPGCRARSSKVISTMCRMKQKSAYLLNRDCRFPWLFLVENGKAHGPRRIYIGVEERGREFACDEEIRYKFSW